MFLIIFREIQIKDLFLVDQFLAISIAKHDSVFSYFEDYKQKKKHSNKGHDIRKLE